MKRNGNRCIVIYKEFILQGRQAIVKTRFNYVHSLISFVLLLQWGERGAFEERPQPHPINQLNESSANGGSANSDTRSRRRRVQYPTKEERQLGGRSWQKQFLLRFGFRFRLWETRTKDPRWNQTTQQWFSSYIRQRRRAQSNSGIAVTYRHLHGKSLHSLHNHRKYVVCTWK